MPPDGVEPEVLVFPPLSLVLFESRESAKGDARFGNGLSMIGFTQAGNIACLRAVSDSDFQCQVSG